MLDKVLTIVAVLTLFATVGVVLWFVPEPDLIIVSIVVLAMVVFDFFIQPYRKKKSGD